MPRIFICYRRRDSDYPAQHIHSELSRHFGADSVVFDVDSVPLGVDFRQYLNEQVSRCDVLLAVIGDKWLTLLDEHPDGEPDFVRIEIEAALKRGIPVVPVLVESAAMPTPANLPEEIKDFAWRNAAEVRGGADLRLHLDRLVRRLERQLSAQEAKRKAEEARKQAEAERRRKEEEATRAAEEERRRQAEQEAKRQAEEEERLKAEEAREQAEAERRRKDEEAKRAAEEEARRQAEQEAKRKAEEEARHREGETRTGEPVKPSAPPAVPPTAASARPSSMSRFLVALGVIGSLLIVGMMIFQKEQPPPRSAPPERPPESEQFSREAELARQLEEARREAEAEKQRQADLARRLEEYESRRLDKLKAEEERGRAEQQVAELIALGTKAEDQRRLTTPTDDNAVAYYREALRLDPGNDAARRGLERVVERYIGWAERAIEAGQFDKAEDYLARAGSVNPDHPEIRRLAADLDRAIHARAPSGERQRTVLGEGFRDTLKDGSKGPEMVVIPAGHFRMGDIRGIGRREELPVHPVRIAKPFAIGKYEVTFEEYDRFAEATGRELPEDRGWGRGRRPVINVSWQDAVAYAEWLSQQTGKRYRLSSEAEWEYPARADTETPFSTGECINTDQANYNGISGWENCPATDVYRAKTIEVGSLDSPNPWGLHDVHGNVWEWTQDCWHENYQGAPEDGSAWEEAKGGDCGRRVIRGGSWSSRPVDVRSASRGWNTTDGRDFGLGFRLAQDLD